MSLGEIPEFSIASRLTDAAISRPFPAHPERATDMARGSLPPSEAHGGLKQGFATGLLHFPGSFAPYRVLRSIYKVTRPAAEFPQIVNNIVGAGIYCPRESYPSTLERRVASLLLTSEKGPGWRQKLLAYASSNIDFLSARALAEVFPESELHELRLLYHHEAHTGGGPAPLPALQLRLIEHQYSNLTWSFDPEIWRDCERAIQAAPAATLDAARPAWERASSILGIPPGVATP